MSADSQRGVRSSAGRTAGVGRGRRLAVGVGAHLRAFLRTPTNALLVVALPVAVIEAYGSAMSAFPALPFEAATALVDLGRVNGAIYTVSFFAGVLGLFQVIGAVQADERLRACGFGRGTLFASRLVTVALGSLAVTAVSLAVLAVRVDVAAPVAAFGALALAALIYGLLGMLVGALVPRALEGSLVLVFLVDFDDFLSSGMLDLDSPALTLLPLHFPHRLVRHATFDGTVPSGAAVGGGAYLLVAFVAAAAVYVALTGDGPLAAEGGVGA